MGGAGLNTHSLGYMGGAGLNAHSLGYLGGAGLNTHSRGGWFDGDGGPGGGRSLGLGTHHGAGHFFTVWAELGSALFHTHDKLALPRSRYAGARLLPMQRQGWLRWRTWRVMPHPCASGQLLVSGQLQAKQPCGQYLNKFGACCMFDTPAMATHEHRSTLPTKDRITPNTSPRRPSEPTHTQQSGNQARSVPVGNRQRTANKPPTNRQRTANEPPTNRQWERHWERPGIKNAQK